MSHRGVVDLLTSDSRSPEFPDSLTQYLGCAGSAGIYKVFICKNHGDTIVLQGSQMPSSSALYFQGTTQSAGGLGSVFGDGLRCAGGSTIRLGTKTNAAGASAYPVSGDPSVSAKGLITAPGARTYQVWYRNAAEFCTPNTFNMTNGCQITWTP